MPAARSERQEDLRSPGAGTSPAMDAPHPFADPQRRQLSQDRQEVLRIFGAGRTVRAPGNPPKHRSRHLAGPGCAAAFRILGACRPVRAPGRSPKPRSGQPGHLDALQALPDPRCRQLDQSTRQISESQERAALQSGLS